MKFPRLSLLCFVLSGISVMITTATANVFDDYLQTAKDSSAAQSYGLVTQAGKFSPKWKEALSLKKKKCDLLTTVTLLAESHRELINENKAADPSKAAKTIDRLSVATNLLRKGKVSGTGNADTNKKYIHFVLTKGVNLAARLCQIKDLGSVSNLTKSADLAAHLVPVPDLGSVFNLISQDFGILSERKEAMNESDTLRFQLALLTTSFYAKAAGIKENFDFLKSLEDQRILGGLRNMLRKNSNYIETLRRGFISKGYMQKAITLYQDPTQRFFEIEEDGTMRSAPRTLFLIAHKESKLTPSKEKKAEKSVPTEAEKPASAKVEESAPAKPKKPVPAKTKKSKPAPVGAAKGDLWWAIDTAGDNEKGSFADSGFVTSLQKTFLINSPEQWQTALVAYTIVLPNAASKKLLETRMRSVPQPSNLTPKLIYYTDHNFLTNIKFGEDEDDIYEDEDD